MSIRNIMAQAQQVYFNNYWKEKIPQYDENDGGFKWDSDNNKAVYNPRSNRLPQLETMWANYKNGAASRGVKADYLTFKKYYDRLKTKHNRDFLLDLQNAELTGISVDKLHDLLRENPGLKQDLINATADGSDVSNQFKSHYFPPKESTFGEMVDENILPLSIAGISTAAAVDYARGVPGQADYDEKIKKSDKIKADAKKKYDKYIDKNHPTDKNGKKISKTKTVKGKRVANPDYTKFTNSKGYKAQTTQYKNSIKSSQDIIKDLKKPEARYKTVTNKFKGAGPSTLGYAAAGFAPTIVEEGLKKAGVADDSAAMAGDATDIMSGLGLLGMGILRRNPWAIGQGAYQTYLGGRDAYNQWSNPKKPSK